MKINLTIEAESAEELRSGLETLLFSGAKISGEPLPLTPPGSYTRKVISIEGPQPQVAVAVPAGINPLSEQVATAWAQADASLDPVAPAPPTVKRERGKPDPASGRVRRTKAEIAEDEAAEAAEQATAATANAAQAAIEAARTAVASDFAAEVERMAAATGAEPATADKRSFWYDYKKDEFLICEPGDELPPAEQFEDQPRFEELTEQQYNRGLLSQEKEAEKAATLTKAPEPPSVDDLVAAMDNVLVGINRDKVQEAARRVAETMLKLTGARRVGDCPPEKRAVVIDALKAVAADLKGKK